MKEYRYRASIILGISVISMLTGVVLLIMSYFKLGFSLLLLFAILFIGSIMEYIDGIDHIYGLTDKEKKYQKILGILLVFLFAILMIIASY